MLHRQPLLVVRVLRPRPKLAGFAADFARSRDRLSAVRGLNDEMVDTGGGDCHS